jgi:hypothetical protein
MASAAPRYGDRKGSKQLTGLEVTSNFDGHVTIVALAEKRRHDVIPGSGEAEIRVKAGGGPVAVPLPDAGELRAALIVVTQTPADYPIRMLLDQRRYTAGQIDEVERVLRAALEDKGYRHFTFTRLKFAPER